jgi:ATP phosphoribosyltransferase regulatory subunit
VAALAHKDEALLADLSTGLPVQVRQGLQALLGLYGGLEVLDRARQVLPAVPLVRAALDDLQSIARHIGSGRPDLSLGVDLGDASGYAYYSGPRFAMYASGCADALARGGRYDEVGAAFGRNRPAVGFSVDLKVLAARLPAAARPAAVRAAWSGDAALRASVRRLRDAGETVVYQLPGDEPSQEAFAFDRELADVGGRWVLRSL